LPFFFDIWRNFIILYLSQNILLRTETKLVIKQISFILTLFILPVFPVFYQADYALIDCFTRTYRGFITWIIPYPVSNQFL